MEAIAATIRWIEPLLRSTNARERWSGVRSVVAEEPQSSWLWPLIILLSLCGLALMLGVLSLARRRTQRRWEEFARQSQRAGLREGELKVLSHMVGLLKLKDPTTILAVDSAFDLGVHRLMQSRKVAAMSEQVHANLAGMLRSMREKLGFRRNEGGEGAGGAVMSSRDIPAGTKLTILATDGGEAREAELLYTDDTQFMVEATQPLTAAEGESLIFRYSTELSLWEFDAAVQKSQGTRMTLGHSFQVRLINRRRFPRVPTDEPAHISLFAFDRSAASAVQELPFHPARLVEIAGVGVVMKTDLTPALGERVLVVMEFADEVMVKGLAKVRRVDEPGEQGLRHVAMELTGLTDDEIAEMVRQTNLAAKRQIGMAVEEAPADAGGASR